MAESIFQTLSARQIAAMCGGVAYGDLEVRAHGIRNDGRDSQAGDLFVALRAARDGHDFIDQARDHGAQVFLVENGRRPDAKAGEAVIAVADTYAALGELGRSLWQSHLKMQPERRTLGITGSNGKTTCKDFAALLLERAFPSQVLATEGNLNSHIGLPMMLAKLSPRHRFVVLEMGASHPGDIAFLVGVASVSRGLVTSLAPAHLEGLGSESDVIREKGQIFAGPQPASVAVVPDTHPELVPSAFSGEVRTFGFSVGSTVRVASYSSGPPTRVELLLSAPVVNEERSLVLEIGMQGRHNASNFAGVVAALWDLLPLETRYQLVETAARDFRPARGRQKWIQGPRGSSLLDDTYNANPGSVEAALRVLAERQGPRWAILGDMLELGKDANALHRTVGELAAEIGCDRVWAVGEMAESLLAGARDGGVSDVAAFPDAQSCASAAKGRVVDSHVILVKGSRSVGLEVVIDALAGRSDDTDEAKGVS